MTLARGAAAVGALAAAAVCAQRVKVQRRQPRWAMPHGHTLEGPLAGRMVGDGPPAVLLLHGMFNAGRYWGATYDELAQLGAMVVPDLLGFGRSPRPDGGYTADAHADAVAETLRNAGAEHPVIVGAHSVGTLVALRLASRHPELVAGVVAFSPPVYASRDDARRQIASIDPLARLFLANERLSRWVCAQMCRHRRGAVRLVRAVRPTLPAPLAEDRVEHSWASYTGTLSNLVVAAEAPGWLADLRTPVTFVAGRDDAAVDVPFLRRLTDHHRHVDLVTLDHGGHDLPLDQPDVCVALLRSAASAARREQQGGVGKGR